QAQSLEACTKAVEIAGLILRPEVCTQSVPHGVAGGIALNGSTDLSGSGKRAKFPPSLRLLRHADFERVYKQGRRHFAAHMTVFYLARAEGTLRVGFTVSKVLGGAVDRNRMKRRLREAVRLQRPDNSLAMDVVI